MRYDYITEGGKTVTQHTTDMKVRIVLYRRGSEVDHQTIQIFEDCGETISSQFIEALMTWQLAPGDTIKIKEV